MKANWFNPPLNRPFGGLAIIRVTVAILLFIHGAHGFAPGAISGFAGYLSSLGFPFGVALVWVIILLQITSSLALIFQRLVVPACMAHMLILLMGIGLIHASHGWFVVGPGKNGMEYSILLTACLFGVLWAYWPSTKVVNRPVVS